MNALARTMLGGSENSLFCRDNAASAVEARSQWHRVLEELEAGTDC